MVQNDSLSPAMFAVLTATAEGRAADGRSWRATDALVRRGLITFTGTSHYELTDAGRELLELEDGEDECEGHESLDGAHMGETVYCDGSCRR